MSYFEKTQILSADSPSIDAFGRWRVSSPVTLFDSKLLTSSSIDLYWSQLTVGNATSSYNALDSLIDLSVSSISGSRAIDQTKRKFVYEPGKSLLIVMTGQMGLGVPGIEKCITYGNDYYGLGFCQSGSSMGIRKRNINSNGFSQTFISQSEWNIDKMDGTGASGQVYNPNFCQIHFLDMEWLGVGRVRFGIFQGGAAYYVHELTHINELTSTYISNPNLPIRYEIINKIGSATSASMKHICCSVISEGGTENLGILRSIDNGVTAVSVGGNAHCGLLFVRQITGSGAFGYKEDSPRVTPAYVTIFPNDAEDVRWTLQLNPVIANSSSLSFVRVDNSSFEYATGSATTTITRNGRVLSSGYVPGSSPAAGATSVSNDIDPFFSLGTSLIGTRDILAVTIQNLEGTAATCFAAMGLKETI